MGEQFCLKWNNHQSTLISVFDTLLETEKHVDCSLAAEGKFLKAHKVVLSACSPYLESLLNHEKDRYPVLVFSDVRYDYLKAMLDYMYRGEVNVLQEHLNGFLRAAETLQIKGLTDQGGGGGGGGGGVGEKRKVVAGGGGGVPSPLGHQDRSNSPTTFPAKRRRQRRPSLEQDGHLDSSNSCDIPPQSATTTNSTASSVTKPLVPPPSSSSHLETDRLSQAATVPPPAPPPPPLQPKLEPVDQSPIVQPKTEFIEEANDEQIEDLTLDDDDDDSYMAKPGSSTHGNDSQGFDSAWQFSGETSNPDMFLSTPQDPSGNQNNSQGTPNDQDWEAYSEKLKIEGRDVYFCRRCEFRSPFRSMFKRHYNDRHSLKPIYYHCSDCDYKAKQKSSIKSHYDRFHNPLLPELQCSLCPYKTKSKNNFKSHLILNHVKEAF